MNKISIIIPMYNCEKYIIKCLESVTKQDYKNKEIIIVDDGSTDKSVEIVSKYIINFKEKNITLYCQNNLNASIARNRGMENATGEYIIFLDADDELENGILSKIALIIQNQKSDLIIGNYEVINQNNKIIKKNIFFSKNSILKNEEIFKKIISISPVPSNKVYSMEIIKKNNLFWGNVRIGQDLNFYLKYLLHCKNVSVVNENMYKYRIVENSISRSYDYRILDIVTSFNDIKKHYKSNHKVANYGKYIQSLELKNYSSHIWKQAYFKTKQERKMIVDYFKIQEKKIDYKECQSYDKKLRLKFKMKCLLKNIYTSKFVCNIIKNKKSKER